MGRSPCCDKDEVKKGAWSREEDDLLVQFINTHGHGSWRTLPKLAGLRRCGKSCRLRWKNYLRPDIRRGPFTPEEEAIIIELHGTLGNRWAAIASHLPQRTDNEVKNFWNTHLRKQLRSKSIGSDFPSQRSPAPSEPSTASSCPSTLHILQWETARLEAEARLSRGTSVYCSPSKGNPYCDIYLRLWNSEVGEAFRKNCSLPKKDREACESSISQISYSIKIEPDQSDLHQEPTISNVPKDTDSLTSKGFSDSSDTALRLLLNVPDDSLGFFQDQEDYFSDFFEHSA